MKMSIAKPAGGPQRILCIEDEADIRAITELALETVGGFVLHCCASGEQAIREAVGFAPELILLDVMMPGMDGPTTLQALRQRGAMAATPVIFMTAKVQPHEVVVLPEPAGEVD